MVDTQSSDGDTSPDGGIAHQRDVGLEAFPFIPLRLLLEPPANSSTLRHCASFPNQASA